MVSGPDNQLIHEAENLLVSGTREGSDYLDKKWTFEEYEEELKKPIDFPDKGDTEDPRYYIKYAHTIPPPEAYYIIPDRKDCFALDDKTKNDRRVYFGWENMTVYEQEGVENLKKFIQESGVGDPPPYFTERDWLKWIQASFYDVAKAGPKLLKHIEWARESSPENPRLTQNALKLLQSGAFYIHGRDKYFRPLFVMDGALMGNLAKKQPELVTPEAFTELFVFYMNYCRKVLFLPGQVEQWITICDLNNMGVTAIPRKQLLAIGELCQSNFLYFLFRSFYVHVGWGQRQLYKALGPFIDPETKLKIQLFGEGDPAPLKDICHPS